MGTDREGTDREGVEREGTDREGVERVGTERFGGDMLDRARLDTVRLLETGTDTSVGSRVLGKPVGVVSVDAIADSRSLRRILLVTVTVTEIVEDSAGQASHYPSASLVASMFL